MIHRPPVACDFGIRHHGHTITSSSEKRFSTQIGLATSPLWADSCKPSVDWTPAASISLEGLHASTRLPLNAVWYPSLAASSGSETAPGRNRCGARGVSLRRASRHTNRSRVCRHRRWYSALARCSELSVPHSLGLQHQSNSSPTFRLLPFVSFRSPRHVKEKGAYM